MTDTAAPMTPPSPNIQLSQEATSTPPTVMGRGRFLLVAFTLLMVWGSAFTMNDIAVRSLSPIWVVMGRILLATIMVAAYTYAKGYKLPPLKDKRWLWYAVLGTIGMALPFFLITKGQETIESGLSAILIGAMPLITIILAHFFTDERMTWIRLVGFLIGFGGLIILFFPEDFSFALVSDWKAQALVLTAAFFYGVATITANRAPETPTLVGASMMLICGAVVSCIGIIGLPQTPPEPIAYLMILGLAIGSTGLGTILYLYMIEMRGPTVMATINYFIPVTSVFLGVWFLGEEITPQIIIAFITIIAGVIVSRIKIKA